MKLPYRRGTSGVLMEVIGTGVFLMMYPNPPASSRPAILIAIEKTDIRERLSALLKDDYVVLPVRSAHSALILVRQFPGAIEGLITTPGLSCMSGMQLARLAMRERSGIGVLFYSSDTDPLPGFGEFQVISQNATDEQLKSAVSLNFSPQWIGVANPPSTKSMRAQH